MVTYKFSRFQKIIAAICVFLFLALCAVDIYTQKVEADMKTSVVRLHIVANSDSEADQAVKLQIRDRILRETKELWDEPDVTRAKDDIARNVPLFEEIANDELSKNGFSQKAKASLGSYYFPTKSYRDLSFPAGEYTALRIAIGEGAGQNWWCVLFPPLCFAGVEEPYMEQESKDALKEVLSEEEYDLVTKEEGELPVKFKFKVVELWQQAKHKMERSS